MPFAYFADFRISFLHILIANTQPLLQRNLRENGGLLDRVIFSVHTEDQDDLAYLDELLKSSSRYSKHTPGPGYKRYVGSWEAVDNSEAIYIKIDDDVVSDYCDIPSRLGN